VYWAGGAHPCMQILQKEDVYKRGTPPLCSLGNSLVYAKRKNLFPPGVDQISKRKESKNLHDWEKKTMMLVGGGGVGFFPKRTTRGGNVRPSLSQREKVHRTHLNPSSGKKKYCTYVSFWLDWEKGGLPHRHSRYAKRQTGDCRTRTRQLSPFGGERGEVNFFEGDMTIDLEV